MCSACGIEEKAIAVTHQSLEAMRYAALTHPTQEFGFIKSTILSELPVMPAKDVFHELVKTALEHEGWTIQKSKRLLNG